nr:hypothetical protein [Tabrizicola flagellatus]
MDLLLLRLVSRIADRQMAHQIETFWLTETSIPQAFLDRHYPATAD